MTRTLLLPSLLLGNQVDLREARAKHLEPRKKMEMTLCLRHLRLLEASEPASMLEVQKSSKMSSPLLETLDAELVQLQL
jgi:hypothetical protein